MVSVFYFILLFDLLHASTYIHGNATCLLISPERKRRRYHHHHYYYCHELPRLLLDRRTGVQKEEEKREIHHRHHGGSTRSCGRFAAGRRPSSDDGGPKIQKYASAKPHISKAKILVAAPAVAQCRRGSIAAHRSPSEFGAEINCESNRRGEGEGGGRTGPTEPNAGAAGSTGGSLRPQFKHHCYGSCSSTGPTGGSIGDIYGG